MYSKKPNETAEQFLFRLGYDKLHGNFQGTWDDVADILNQELDPPRPKSESTWRKKISSMLGIKEPQRIREPETDAEVEQIDRIAVELERLNVEKVLLREERAALNREKKSAIHIANIQDIIAEKIQTVKPSKSFDPKDFKPSTDKVMYVMLSDLHYGIEFNNIYGTYNTEIAAERLEKYACYIEHYAKLNKIRVCYVSLMGDMISGNIHTTTRIENREGIIAQVVGASELIKLFLKRLGDYFDLVYINSVSGNHSRIDQDAEAALSHEKLDNLIFYYAKTALKEYKNMMFDTTNLDSTIGVFEIFDQLYISVHGDYDKDLKTTARKMTAVCRQPVYAVLAGHVHVSSARFEDVAYIYNGSVVGSGDDYTVKKRLYGNPMQNILICGETGIEQYIPINLR